MKMLVVSGKTIEDAVNKGLKQMGVLENQVTVRILEQPSRGFFGLGARAAKVELTFRSVDNDLATAALVPTFSKECDLTEKVKQFIIDVTRAMGIEVKVIVYQRKNTITFDLSGAELGRIIGRRGQTLDSLQYLINLVANRYTKHHFQLILDAEQFRERRKQTLELLSEKLANKVIGSKQTIVLEPMSAQDRKTIHKKLQNHLKVKTCSKGVEPNRCVVIVLK